MTFFNVAKCSCWMEQALFSSPCPTVCIINISTLIIKLWWTLALVSSDLKTSDLKIRKRAMVWLVCVAGRDPFTSTVWLGHWAEDKPLARDSEDRRMDLKSDVLHWFLPTTAMWEKVQPSKVTYLTKKFFSKYFPASSLSFYFPFLCSRAAREFKTVNYRVVTMPIIKTVMKYYFLSCKTIKFNCFQFEVLVTLNKIWGSCLV